MARFRSSLAVVVLSFLCGIGHVHSKDGFIATLPKVLRHGTQSEVCVTMYGPVTQTATIRLVHEVTGEHAMEVEEDYVPGIQKCSQFQVPPPGKYMLIMVNDTDILHDAVEVRVHGDKPLTLIQTDKPIYKPGQLVRFRILTMLHNMKPRTGTISSVYIIDPNEIRVKQYLDIDNQGLTTLEFQLVDRAKLGDWTIEVTLEENSKPTKVTFQVDEYVLPRFEVTIKPPAYILATDDVIKGQVCATYTYGKPVKGFLDLTLAWGPGHEVKRVVEISGCHNFSVTRQELRVPASSGLGGPSTVYWRGYYSGELRVDASVTEAGTGVVVNKTHTGPREGFEPLKITMEDYTNGVFKPGLPYFGKVTVTRPDGSPASGENIEVRATTSPVTTVYSQNFTTDAAGVVVFALCDSFTENSTSISLRATAIEYEKNGPSLPNEPKLHTPTGYRHIKQWFSPSLSYIQIPKIETEEECHSQLTLSIPFTTVPGRDVKFTYQIMSRGQIVKTGHVLYDHDKNYPGQDYSTAPEAYCLKPEEIPTPPPNPTLHPTPPTPEMEDDGEDDGVPAAYPDDIDIRVEDGNAPPPPPPDYPDMIDVEDGDIAPPGTPPILHEEFREPIVRSEVVSSAKANFILDFTISTVMSPSFTLLVYHVMPDGEVVADSMEFKVKPCFANDVGLKFDKSKALPGEDVTLSLTAAPGSVCGVGVVDKSVNILGGDHQITSDVVFKRIEELSQRQFEYDSFPFMRVDDNDYCESRIKGLSEALSNPDEYWFYSSPYVDAIQAFKSSGFLVITNLQLETRPCERTFPIYYDLPMAQLENDALPGPVPMLRRGQQERGPHSKPKARVRTEFPETWLWSLQVVGETGQTDLPEKAPDTVTSWVGNALCMDQDQGFGVSELTSLTTFQPFFVSLQLPYAAVRGEILPLILTVYNYMEKCLNIQVSLDGGEDIEVPNSGQTAPFCLRGSESQSKRFYVTPKNIGSLQILAKAAIVPGVCDNSVEMDLDHMGYSDAVRRSLLVKVEGVTQEYTRTSYVCTKEGEPDREDVVLPLPDNVVKDSAHGEVKVIGDIMGPVMNNLDNLVRMPTGCGEQNMVGFVPNICVLKYLTNTGRLEEEIEMKATKNMEIGYQRELTYRHKDGSYSAFGEKDDAGSVWLTAFVVKSYAQAKPYIFIDDKDMELSVQFLKRSQLETGCFRETGKVFSSYMMGGLSKGKKKNSYTALSAYVLAALLQADVEPTEPVIVEGMKCINRAFSKEKETMEPYSLALVAYVNTLFKPHTRFTQEVISALDTKAKKAGSLRFWGRDTPKPPSVDNWYYIAAPSAEVEMTSYALLALLNFYGEQAVAQTYDVAMWLSQQRNPRGGFSSTQDTVMGLQALAEFAELAYSDDGSDLKVAVSGQGISREFEVSDDLENTLLLQREDIPELPNKLTIQTSGRGCVLVQTTVQYNKPTNKMAPGGSPPVYLKVKRRLYQHNIDRCDRRTLDFKLRLRSKKFSSGMSLLSVRMVTGWRPVEDSLVKLTSQFPKLGIKQYEYKEDEGLVTFYFDEMTKRPKSFTLDVEQDKDMRISNTKPADVTLMQYYETGVKTIKSYSLKTTCGTKLSIPRKQPEFVDGFPVQVRIDSFRDFPRAILEDVDRNAEGCPACSKTRQIPENLRTLVCQSAAIYKGLAGRKGKKPLKIKQDIRPLTKGEGLNIFAKYEMPEGCECNKLNPPSSRVTIFVSQKIRKKTIRLDSSSVVLPSTRILDKEIRKARRTCGAATPGS